MLICGKPSVIIANDATNCYDQVLLPVVVLATLRPGLPEPAASFMLSILKNAQYYVLHLYQHSSRWWSVLSGRCIDKTEQGTGWPPSIKILVSDILLTVATLFYAGLVISTQDGPSEDI